MQENNYHSRKLIVKKMISLSHFYNIVTTFVFGFLCFGQIYVVRVLREGQVEPTFVFRTFDEFQELHNKLGILFPLWKLPGYVPNSLITITTEATKLLPAGWRKKYFEMETKLLRGKLDLKAGN